jgi:hypothetical protein
MMQQSEATSTKDCQGRCQDQTLLVWVKMTLTSESPGCPCAAGALGMLHRKGIGHFGMRCEVSIRRGFSCFPRFQYVSSTKNVLFR